METKTIPFDFKITKLQGSNWNRKDLGILAKQLMERQGSARYHLDNRIVIAFDKSTTSSLKFWQRNERIMLEKLIQMLKNPYPVWHKLIMDKQTCFICILLIKETEYYKLKETHEHIIKNGIVEEDKAKWSHIFLQHAEWISDGAIKPHNNPKEKGIDGYITLPSELFNFLENKNTAKALHELM